MDYRFAKTDDAAVLAVLNHALIHDEGHRNPMLVAELQARMAGWLDGEYRAVLFEESGQPVGYALFRWDADYVYLRQFFVRAENRRCGIGTAAIAWLRKNAWGEENRVRVEVLVGNVAGIAFWRAVGFQDYCLTLELQGGNRGEATSELTSRLTAATAAHKARYDLSFPAISARPANTPRWPVHAPAEFRYRRGFAMLLGTAREVKASKCCTKCCTK